ncbi:MAG: PTS sugar transporter subunit IIA [Planctomycetota bacterium]|nr:MAG: PTS sugar transporter subunit IIA [Planctomycetota bacterium]
MKLVDYLRREDILMGLTPGSKAEVLQQIVDYIGRIRGMDEFLKKALYQKLLFREQLKSTGIGNKIAVPHAILESISQTFVCLAICQEGTDFDSIDKESVHLILTLVGPLKDRPLHLRLLACIARLMIRPEIPKQILESETPDQIYRILEKSEKSSDCLLKKDGFGKKTFGG